MPHARNPVDGSLVYFEEEGGGGVPVVFHGGLLDSVDDVCECGIAQALPAEEFRPIADRPRRATSTSDRGQMPLDRSIVTFR